MGGASPPSREGANLELLSVVDSRKVKEAGASIEDVQEAVEANLDKARNFVANRYPNVQVEMHIAEGEVVENIVDASLGCDLIVLGSHHGISVGDTIGGAKPLRVAVSAAVPTAVIPADWAEDYDGEGVVVGIDPDGSTKQALDFSIAEAIATEQPLRLITGWGLPAWISKPAEAMGGGLGRLVNNIRIASIRLRRFFVRNMRALTFVDMLWKARLLRVFCRDVRKLAACLS